MFVGDLEVYGVIYKIKNKINNKSYIGQTTKGFDQRYSNNVYLNTHNIYLKRAFDKYGEDSFEINKCIDFAFSRDELNVKEECWIKVHESNNPLFGYNSTTGGENFKVSEETKRKISEIQTGRRLTDDWKENIRKSHKGKTPKNMDILLENNDRVKLTIVEMDNNFNFIKEWKGINDCSRSLGIPATNLVKCLKGKHLTCNNRIFMYKNTIQEKTKDEIREIRNKQRENSSLDKNINLSKSHNLKMVGEFDAHGLLLKTYNSVDECARETGFTKKKVYNILNGQTKANERNIKYLSSTIN